MKKVLILLILFSASFTYAQKGWTSLFDGKTFDGWHINEDDPSCFSIEDGVIKVAGKRA